MLVSVVMAVHNGARFLKPALTSVLGQTMAQLELIVVDDGSTDETADILARCVDRRLRVVHQKRTGQNAALNHGLSLARGDFIARQDADDVWLPGRLEWQMSHLERHPEVGAVGSQAVSVDVATRPLGVTRLPITPMGLRWHILFECPFVHSSVLLRRRVLDAVGLYRTDDAVGQAADYDLWSRIGRISDLANAPVPLVLYREHPGSMSKQESEIIANRVPRVREANLVAAVGDEALAERMARHARTLRLEHATPPDVEELRDAVGALIRVESVFLAKFASELARDPEASAEVCVWVIERLLVAARLSVRLGESGLSRQVARAIAWRVARLMRSKAGTIHAIRLFGEVMRRCVWESDRYHAWAGKRALAAALQNPTNRSER
jgi:glycosyltransferase involved in cell wall biosynthesis